MEPELKIKGKFMMSRAQNVFEDAAMLLEGSAPGSVFMFVLLRNNAMLNRYTFPIENVSS